MKYNIVAAQAKEMGSHPARGAWIEILLLRSDYTVSVVAPRKGCVD